VAAYLCVLRESFQDVDGARQFEKIAPGIRTAGEDDVASRRVAPNVDLRAFETVFGGQADGLTAAVAEDLGGVWHGIYHDIYQ
jgi:hypothetical protein